VIGGRENAISVARSLGRRGIRVYALNHSRALVRFSRYCKRLKAAGETQANWLAYLLSPWTVKVRGAFLIACSDDGLQLLIENREALLQKGYRLDLCDTNAQATVLDKLRTVEAAARAGVPAPKHWVVESIADVERIRDELSFPLILKPLHAHVFTARFAGRKYLKARSYQEVHGTIAKMEAAKVPFMLQELIEGPDTLLCSYYTYLDEDLEPQFDFTKAIVRRFPVNEGGATYHVVTRDPEVQEIARRFVKGVGLRGLSVTEFKRDRRDGKLKLIECNGRLSAANNVVMEAGFDLPIWLYNRAVGIPQDPLPSDYRTNLHLWYPVRDFKAFRQLRARGEMTFKGWMRSIRPKGVKKITPFWSWRDPLPSLVEASRVTRGLLRKVLAMPFRRWPRPTPRPAAPVGETRERTPS
jgi:predicted ATP-grasp superfamily ATP-dependent carboligase